MLKENISLTQLLALLVNFLLGSAIVIGVGTEAKNDAWIAISAGSVCGVGILFFYLFFMSRLPGKNLFEIIEFCIGRKLSILLSFIYITYFLYTSSRIIRDFGELMASAIMPNTPIELISLTITMVIGYILYLGIEVLGRTSEIFTPYLFGFLFLLTIFLIASGNIDLYQIKPVLAEGIKPVIKTVFPGLIVFPFGELIVFTVILCNVTNSEKVPFVSLLGVGIASFLLIFSSFLMIATLGVDGLQRANFPLLSVAREVSIGNFIERIDAIVVFIMMLGILVKGSVFLFGSLKGMEYVFRLPFRYFAMPSAMLVSFFSIVISVNFADHLQEGLKLVPYYLHLPLQFAVPFILLIILIWKQRKNKNKQTGWKHGSNQQNEKKQGS